MNKGKICVSVCADTADEMIANIKRAEEFADVIEVRFDCLDVKHSESLLENLPETTKTYLFTFRPNSQGGKRELALEERLKFWARVFCARKSGFIVDIEFEPAILFAIDPSKTERIVSFHDYSGQHENFDFYLEAMSEIAGSTLKIADQVKDITDSIPIWKLLERAKAERKKIIPIAMGEAGKWTRILGLAHGAYMTYASLDAGMETADGQITAKDLVKTYRVKDLNLDTQLFGVIGDPVSESLSPYIHNPEFAAQNINAVFIPLLVRDLDEFIRRMVRPETREVELNFGGFAVTMPHKQAIIKHLDAIDPTAEKIGAVNTVKSDGGNLTGYNTDAHGFITPLKERFADLAGTRVAVFGAGGAARACVFALKQENADVTVFARDAETGKALASEFSIPFEQLNTNHGSRASDVDIVVNATPLGMKGALENESLFTADHLKGVKFVYDLVTSRTETPLIREAKKANVPSIGGLEMLIHQAANQFEIWTGVEAPLDLMRRSAEERTR